MTRLVVSDTSVLSALAEIELIEGLLSCFGTVTITQAVFDECSHERAPLALREWIANPPDWLNVVGDPVDYLPVTRTLGDGEASSITLAWSWRSECLLLLDERRGRRVADGLGLQMTSTLALIAQAGARGEVDFDEALIRLNATGFRLLDSVIAEARKMAESHNGN
jgi:predicted nucleic acid-binding protein